VRSWRELVLVCGWVGAAVAEHVHDRYVVECLQLDKGYVLKGYTGVELTDALRAIVRGGTYLAPSLQATPLQSLPSKTTVKEPLAVQERRVLQLTAEVKSTKEIGELDISYKTVQSHRTNIMNKVSKAPRVWCATPFDRGWYSHDWLYIQLF